MVSKLMNSITLCLYKKELSKVPEVARVIKPYTTLLSYDVPIAVFLFTVIKYCALFVAIIAQTPGTVIGLYAKADKVEGHVEH